MIELWNYIDTEKCSFCAKLTECLQLSENMAACYSCITEGFQKEFDAEADTAKLGRFLANQCHTAARYYGHEHPDEPEIQVVLVIGQQLVTSTAYSQQGNNPPLSTQ